VKQKFSVLIAIVKFIAKFLKSTKLIQAMSVLISMCLYSVTFGIKFALLLISAIFFHELGHCLVARRWIKIHGIYLIPFVGGVAIPEEDFPHSWSHAMTALGGPFIGLLMTIILFVLGLAYNNTLLLVSTSWVALMNLFNLLPIYPMDGGRVLYALCQTRSSSGLILTLIFSIILASVIMIYFKLYILGLILFISFLELLLGEKKPSYMTRTQFTVSLFGYLALIGLFIYILYTLSHIPGAFDFEILYD